MEEEENIQKAADLMMELTKTLIRLGYPRRQALRALAALFLVLDPDLAKRV